MKKRSGYDIINPRWKGTFDCAEIRDIKCFAGTYVPIRKAGVIVNTVQLIWTGIMVVFLVTEAATAGITSIWFALGAAAALVSGFFGAKLWLQIILFFAVSIGTLIVTRPLARKYINKKVQATNADMVIGRMALVTERVDDLAGTGTATVDGRVWTARSADGGVLEEGTLAQVKAIEGVKLMLASNAAEYAAEHAGVSG